MASGEKTIDSASTKFVSSARPERKKPRFGAGLFGYLGAGAGFEPATFRL
jgi:hypothetical protein